MAEPSNKEIETKKFLIEFLEKNSCLEIHDEESGFMLYTERKKKNQVLHLEAKLMQCL